MFSNAPLAVAPAITFNHVAQKLTPDHLYEMLILQDKVMDSLCDIQKSFMIPKSRANYEALLAGEQHHGIGVFTHQGQLIAQAWTSKLEKIASIYGVLPLPPVLAFMKAQEANYSIHNVMTDPEFRKQGVMGLLIDSLVIGSGGYIAEIALANVASKTGFDHHGFVECGMGVDESDGTELVYMSRKV